MRQLAHATIGADLVQRHWGTGIVVTAIDLEQIVRTPLPAGLGTGTKPVEQVNPASVVADEAALRAEMATSINAVAATHDDGPHAAADLDLEVLLWQAGYDQPGISHPAAHVAWCYLACSPPPPNTESGALAFPDPRSGSAQTAMPGLPWGRQLMVAPTPGAHVAVPGWLTYSVVPLAQGQWALVAFAAAR